MVQKVEIALTCGKDPTRVARLVAEELKRMETNRDTLGTIPTVQLVMELRRRASAADRQVTVNTKRDLGEYLTEQAEKHLANALGVIAALELMAKDETTSKAGA